MARQVTKTPKTGRPRVHPYKPGDGGRPQLAFSITGQLMMKIRTAMTRSGRTQSGECEVRLERSFIADDLMTQRYGANAALVTIIADATDAARHLGEALAAREDFGQDDREVHIYSAIIETVRTIVAWCDPASNGTIVNPKYINGGALTWQTLPIHAAWIAYNHAASDPKRLAALKAVDQKHKRTR